MRNFAKPFAVASLLCVCAMPVGAQTAEPGAENPSSAEPTFTSAVAARYTALREQDMIVLNSWTSSTGDFRTVVDRYWSFVRRNPTSGYSDNALWQAATLSAESFKRFGDDRDKQRTIQLLQWLRDQYPHSSLRAFALNQLATFGEQPAVAGAAAIAATETAATTTITAAPMPLPAQAAPVPGPASAALAAVLAADGTNARAMIRGVQREVLPEVVRVTVEIDREVAFSPERIEGPSRLFFDLKGTRTVPALVDATFRYDSDVVRHIRFGRHPNNTTRVVLDLENVGRYSVFTLYNPYRIVIDAERKAATAVLAAKPSPKPAQKVAVAEKAVDRPVEKSVERPAEKPGMHTLRSVPVTRTASMTRIPTLNTAVRLRTPAPVGPLKPVPPPPKVIPMPVLASHSPLINKPVTGAPAGAIVSLEPLGPEAPPAPAAPRKNASGKFSVARQLGLGVSRIVIDAGHGGHDPGATANEISEAELVLDVALRLETLLQQQEGVDVVLTRRTNDFVSLEERTEIANRESADLFLSIHANASANAVARGVETYFLNFALDPQAEAVAARENAASGKTMNSLPGIIKAITLNSKLNESRDFATSVQRALVRGMRPGNKTLRDLGVKQAPFMVLIGASMPSVLAEISFVTNKQEARLLKTPAYRQRIAESLLSGVLRYQESLKKVDRAALQ